MAKLKIYTFPDDVLRKKANPIERVEKELHQLADNMLETMYDYPGIGLAANQVGILKQILVMDTEYEVTEPEENEETGEVTGSKIITHQKPKIIINPRIIQREGKITYAEGCLSVPEYRADVERSEKIKIEYQDIDGVNRTLSAEGLQAVCIQHEMDHLEGKLFIDRLSPLKKEMIKKKLIKERKSKL